MLVTKLKAADPVGFSRLGLEHNFRLSLALECVTPSLLALCVVLQLESRFDQFPGSSLLVHRFFGSFRPSVVV